MVTITDHFGDRTMNVGDTVQLKGSPDGPIMTVKGPAHKLEGATVVCQWFEDKKYHEQNFPIASLVSAEPKKPQ
jgi:uncharacterized protein YodC (DUF2158 family)